MTDLILIITILVLLGIVAGYKFGRYEERHFGQAAQQAELTYINHLCGEMQAAHNQNLAKIKGHLRLVK